ncbi:hypothetical protein BDN70DRAFT_826282 [Pholiota conissans]|uniref:DUF6535 domain-containing protein n=1 Tax=Pholiota conissans TaxID=109636 RepID=A0A9P5ZBZ0_9AGAR|nr:hypothetical protein BDN70DRAFT_826282 [Pholiota conissans]
MGYLLKPEMEADKIQCDAWKDEVQTLLIFAGLFAVVTAFVIESYKFLLPDPNDTIISLLTQIANAPNNSSSPPLNGGSSSMMTSSKQTSFLVHQSNPQSHDCSPWYHFAAVAPRTPGLSGILCKRNSSIASRAFRSSTGMACAQSFCRSPIASPKRRCPFSCWLDRLHSSSWAGTCSSCRFHYWFCSLMSRYEHYPSGIAGRVYIV